MRVLLAEFRKIFEICTRAYESIREKTREKKRLHNTKLNFFKKGLTKLKNRIIIARHPEKRGALFMKLISLIYKEVGIKCQLTWQKPMKLKRNGTL